MGMIVAPGWIVTETMADDSSGTASSSATRDRDRLQVLYSVSAMLRQVEAGGLDLDAILPRVLSIAIDVLTARNGSIILADERWQAEHFWHVDDSGQAIASRFVSEVLTDGIAGQVIQHRQSVIIDDTSADTRWLPRPGHPTALEPWSALCVPLSSREHTFGAITVLRPGGAQFDDADLSLLETIASQAATTIENARLLADSEHRARKLATLVAATQAISANLRTSDLMRVVPEQMARLLEASSCMIVRWVPHLRRFRRWMAFPTGLMMPTDAPWAAGLLEIPEPHQVSLVSPNLPADQREWLEGIGAQTAVTVPFMAQGRVLGLALILDNDRARRYSEQEIALLQTMASQAVASLENARLYERTQRQLQESAFLNEAGKVVNSTLDLNQMIQALLEKINEILNVEALSIAMLDKASNELVFQVSVGVGSAEIVGLRIPATAGVSGWVLRHGLPALVPDTSADARVSPAGDARTGHPTRAIICAPLQARGRVFGTIQAINPYVGTFNEDDLQLLGKLASMASSAIDNARQFGETLAAEARYLGLFEDSIDAILLTDAHGFVIGTNRRGLQFLGYSRDELLGMHISQLHPDEPDLLSGSMLARIQTDAYVFSSQVLTQSGSMIPVEVHARRVSTTEGGMLQWIHRDITEQVELESMREDLMAMLFHDLQSPLSNVISGLELLEYELDPEKNSKAVAILRIAGRSSQRLHNLIRSLLDINRLEAGYPISNRAPTTIETLLSAALEVVEPAMQRRRVALATEIDPDLPDLHIDGDMITRVLVNLLDNALKYCEGGKQVTLSAAMEATTGRVRICVADQGPGIPPATRQAVFDKFFRIQGRGGAKGLGLGLAFCRMAVEGHGGAIWVEDAPGGGAMFCFTLPIGDEALND